MVSLPGRSIHPLAVVATIGIAMSSIGPHALHALSGCVHHHSTETSDHPETDALHWAAVSKVSSADGECPVCLNSKTYAVVANHPGMRLLGSESEAVATFSIVSLRCRVGFCLIPRAPPGDLLSDEELTITLCS